MKANFAMTLALVVSILSAQPAASDDQIFAQAHQWFEWGEYQRMVDSLPIVLNQVQSHNKKAEMHAYLGVGYFAVGMVRDSRASFIRAYELNEAVALDPAYVSREILDFFETTIQERKSIRKEKTRRDSVAQMHWEQQKRIEATRDSLQRLHAASAIRRRTIGAYASLSCAAALAAGAVFEHVRAEKSYAAFELAANSGDLRAYERNKDATLLHDVKSIGYGALSGASFILSAFLVRRVVQLKARHKKQDLSMTTRN